MSPMIKRVLAAVAVKKAYDFVQERRRPQKRSFVARFAAPTLALATAGGAIAYLGKTGKLQPLLDGVTGNSSSPAEAEASPAPPPAPATTA
jgi:hypothetical protein